MDAISKLKTGSNKIALHLIPDPKDEVIVSKESAPNFKPGSKGKIR